jgi:hypothetical protein
MWAAVTRINDSGPWHRRGLRGPRGDGDGVGRG